MSDDTERMLGQLDGKMDQVIEMLRDHISLDERRFNQVDAQIASHAADINKAKGAKAAIFAGAAAIAGFVGAAVAAAEKIFK